MANLVIDPVYYPNQLCYFLCMATQWLSFYIFWCAKLFRQMLLKRLQVFRTQNAEEPGIWQKLDKRHEVRE